MLMLNTCSRMWRVMDWCWSWELFIDYVTIWKVLMEVSSCYFAYAYLMQRKKWKYVKNMEIFHTWALCSRVIKVWLACYFWVWKCLLHEKHKYSLMHVLCKLHRLFRFASISSLSSSSHSFYTHTYSHGFQSRWF